MSQRRLFLLKLKKKYAGNKLSVKVVNAPQLIYVAVGAGETVPVDSGQLLLVRLITIS